MKIFMKLFMAVHVAIYRLTGGKVGGKFRGFNVILLNTKGRKSGKSFTTPLGNFYHPDGYVLVASNTGSSSQPDWYFNLISNPKTTVQVLDKVIPVTAEILTGDARSRAWQEVITSAPLYADYETKTTREIPLFLLRPDH